MDRIGLRLKPVLVAMFCTALSLFGVLAVTDGGSAIAGPTALALIVIALGLLIGEDRRQSEARDFAVIDVLSRELERSRRHGRHLAIARVAPAGQQEQGFNSRSRRTDAISSIARRLRAIDEVVGDGENLLLVLAETDREHAEACIRRLAMVEPGIVDRERTRVAVFPDDAVTLGGLLGVLDGGQAHIDPTELPTISTPRRVTIDVNAAKQRHRATEIDA